MNFDPVKYILPLKEAFRENSNVENALQMSKYMKGHFPFWGIKSPERKALSNAFLKQTGLPEVGVFPSVMEYLWQLPQREFQYFGINLLEKDIKRKVPEDRILLYKFLTQTKSWWDSVDGIAGIVGSFCLKFPLIAEKYMDEWNRLDNMWLNRISIIYQLKYKSNTNESLLTKYILKHSASKEFFHRKAIGWALREYSKTKPEFVFDFTNRYVLSNLSKTEALKVINRKKNH